MLVYFAIILVALIGFCGLAVDVGRVELRSLQLQAAADAGALSGAAEWGHGASATAWKAAAQSDAQANQTLDGYATTGTTVTSQLTASGGPYATDYAAVQTTVSQPVPTMFLGLLQGGATSVTLTRRAVADPPPCMYFFGSPASYHANGGLDLSSAGMQSSCPVYSKIRPVVDGFSGIYGQQLKTSVAGSGNVFGGGSTSYTPFYSFPTQSDPLAYVNAPVYSGCDYIGLVILLPFVTLHPGTYCGSVLLPGLTVTGFPVTLTPGLYIFTNGVSFTNTTINGTGVTLYLTKGGLNGYGRFYEANSAIRLTAPTDSSNGGIPGVTLFTDRNWVGGNEDVVFQSGSWYGDGVIYSMGTGLSIFNINFSAPNYMNMVVANEDSYLGTIYSSANYSTVTGGSPLHNAVSLVQ